MDTWTQASGHRESTVLHGYPSKVSERSAAPVSPVGPWTIKGLAILMGFSKPQIRQALLTNLIETICGKSLQDSGLSVGFKGFGPTWTLNNLLSTTVSSIQVLKSSGLFGV